MSNTKTFHCSEVMMVTTGITLCTSGWHEIMDHFHPGIMTLSAAHMMSSVGERIKEEHPELYEVNVSTLPDFLGMKRDDAFLAARAWAEGEASRVGLPVMIEVTA